MSNKRVPLFFLSLIAFTTATLVLLYFHAAGAAGPTADSWPSFRHDLLNSGAATDSGYPDTLNVLWAKDREERSWGTGPAAQAGPSTRISSPSSLNASYVAWLLNGYTK